MLSKSKSLDFVFEWPPWIVSSGIHIAFLLGIGLVLLLDQALPTKAKVDMEIIDMPAPAARPAVPLPAPIQKPVPQQKAVFGATKKSITVPSNAEGLDVKAGNTVAKTPDNEILKDDDPNSLPIPVDEFTVTEMPALKTEFRIPYPPEARKAGIQGPVIMDILIDSSGTVREARLIQGPGFGLNEAALEAVRKFAFKPAKIAEKSVAVRIRYSYRFVLER